MKEEQQMLKPLSHNSFKNEVDFNSFLKENDLLPTPESKEENPGKKKTVKKLKNDLEISLKQLRNLAIPMNYMIDMNYMNYMNYIKYMNTGDPQEIKFYEENEIIEIEVPKEMKSKLTVKPNIKASILPVRISKSIPEKKPIKVLKKKSKKTRPRLCPEVDEILMNLIRKSSNIASRAQRRER
mmetsp:Transcript_26401/g.23330  ORF Transcript_26401/g.23330 Transcript_26401/m.23330 type:complete len:183 (+) Transcript_26401:161-709(+)|eukprot:CAMPEP_0205809222 /NCGR_PEP_ID=MMETSP0205-20121125/13378_1 /ASSEMBLY_ACC=CAM_ASM_000278 /TAXON_ID=36767 /ORGANISM="Euplotes focardii, Strain TN1" /LENGTH=182 /DNA_ID=CAMNT_0053086089 /DNA_START=690 /DNA_END=1238 /DNA_ORIENTATION=+